ncbi:MAG TPA: hypothetical protein VKB96_15180, partial [Gammaproteobacteria bacterium]|nr:hypothetical protein [Gammaproteobacteria bacterium]
HPRKDPGDAYFDFLLSYNDSPPRRFSSGNYLTEALTEEVLEFTWQSQAHWPDKPFFFKL